jgi:hypothetical protein
VLRRESAPGRLVVVGIATLVCGVLFAALHHELPFLAYWTGACSPDDYAYECAARPFYDAVAGVAFTLSMGALALLALRYAPFRPTITCRGCGTRGFVLDIEPSAGRCPRCSNERFDYQIWFGGGGALGPRLERFREHDVAVADLVQRFQETRKSSTQRYL